MHTHAHPCTPAHRFDFPHIKVDQYGLPDSLMAAIKGSVAFGGQQLESPAMQMNLDLHALATLRNAMKLGERSLYLGDTLQRSSPKSGGPGGTAKHAGRGFAFAVWAQSQAGSPGRGWLDWQRGGT